MAQDHRPVTTPPTLTEEMQVAQVPLPDQMPPSLPMEIGPSRTLESLMVQNEDLTARLSVSHRRSAEMERQVREVQCQYNELAQRMEILSDQLLIYREKDKSVQDRHLSYEKAIERFRSQIEVQNVRYAELYNKSREQQSQLSAEVHSLQKEALRLRRYRQRIDHRVRPMVSRQKAKIEEQTSALSELHRMLGESGEHIRNQKDRLNDLQREFHAQKTDLENQLETSLPFQKKYLQLKEERTVQQNRVIAAERTRDEALHTYRGESQRLSEAISHHRGQSKTLALEVKDLHQRISELEDERESLKEKNDKLQEQTESLQAVWGDSVKKLKTTNEKETTLKKLNQELSLQLQELRTEKLAQEKHWSERLADSEERVKKLFTENELIAQSEEKQKSQSPLVNFKQEDLDQLEILLAKMKRMESTEDTSRVTEMSSTTEATLPSSHPKADFQ